MHSPSHTAVDEYGFASVLPGATFSYLHKMHGAWFGEPTKNTAQIPQHCREVIPAGCPHAGRMEITTTYRTMQKGSMILPVAPQLSTFLAVRPSNQRVKTTKL